MAEEEEKKSSAIQQLSSSKSSSKAVRNSTYNNANASFTGRTSSGMDGVMTAINDHYNNNATTANNTITANNDSKKKDLFSDNNTSVAGTKITPLTRPFTTATNITAGASVAVAAVVTTTSAGASSTVASVAISNKTNQKTMTHKHTPGAYKISHPDYNGDANKSNNVNKAYDSFFDLNYDKTLTRNITQQDNDEDKSSNDDVVQEKFTDTDELLVLELVPSLNEAEINEQGLVILDANCLYSDDAINTEAAALRRSRSIEKQLQIGSEIAVAACSPLITAELVQPTVRAVLAVDVLVVENNNTTIKNKSNNDDDENDDSPSLAVRGQQDQQNENENESLRPEQQLHVEQQLVWTKSLRNIMKKNKTRKRLLIILIIVFIICISIGITISITTHLHNQNQQQQDGSLPMKVDDGSSIYNAEVHCHNSTLNILRKQIDDFITNNYTSSPPAGSSENIYYICPGTNITVAQWTNPQKDDFSFDLNNGLLLDYPLWIIAPNTKIVCGYGNNDNSPQSNNHSMDDDPHPVPLLPCIIKSGLRQVYIRPLAHPSTSILGPNGIIDNEWVAHYPSKKFEQIFPLSKMNSTDWDIYLENSYKLVLDNITIQGITFSGVLKSTDDYLGKSVVLRQEGDVLFEDCTWIDITAPTGLISVGACSQGQWCLNNQPLPINSASVTMKNCLFQDILYNHPLLLTYDQNIYINNCTFNDIHVVPNAHTRTGACEFYERFNTNYKWTEYGSCAYLIACGYDSYCEIVNSCASDLCFSDCDKGYNYEYSNTNTNTGNNNMTYSPTTPTHETASTTTYLYFDDGGLIPADNSNNNSTSSSSSSSSGIIVDYQSIECGFDIV